MFDLELKVKGKGIIQPVNCHWETLATNLEEFREVVVRSGFQFALVGRNFINCQLITCILLVMSG